MARRKGGKGRSWLWRKLEDTPAPTLPEDLQQPSRSALTASVKIDSSKTDITRLTDPFWANHPYNAPQPTFADLVAAGGKVAAPSGGSYNPPSASSYHIQPSQAGAAPIPVIVSAATYRKLEEEYAKHMMGNTREELVVMVAEAKATIFCLQEEEDRLKKRMASLEASHAEVVQLAASRRVRIKQLERMVGNGRPDRTCSEGGSEDQDIEPEH